MNATTPPIIESIESPRLALWRRPAVRRVAWLVADLGATAAFLVYAVR